VTPTRAGAGPRPPSDDGGGALDAYSFVVTGVADRVLPSVASVTVPHRHGRTRWPAGQGSAVVLHAEGLLLTSAHVVAGTTSGRVRLVDVEGEERAEVVGIDPLSDLAILRVEREHLAAVELGDADRLLVGQLVVAVGNPLGYAGSVSAGVVSAVGRTLPTRDGEVVRLVEDVIQTDAALHPGNSGGALADAAGRLVGIATALIGPAVGQGLGLAVPINARTRRIIAELIDHGAVHRAFIGIAGGVRPLPPRAVERTGRGYGIEVVTVVTGSPADRAGIRTEDVIVSFEGVAIERMGHLQELLTGDRVGRPLPVEVVRGGQVRTLVLAPDELRSSQRPCP
jgi:S1-C subfamily serine protease